MSRHLGLDQLKARLYWAVALAVVLPTAALAQADPRERTLPPPSAEWNRGFTTITSIRELAGGRTLVADVGEQRLYLVDWDEGTLEEVLRHGEGPGEYERVGWLYPAGDDQTLFTTRPGFRWILMRGTEAVETFTSSEPLNGRFRARLDGVSDAGRILAPVSTVNPRFEVAEERNLELAPGIGPYEELPELDTIRTIRGNGGGQAGCVIAGALADCNYLETEDQAVLFPDGWIAVAFVSPFHVEWRSPGGEWIRGEAQLPDGHVILTDADRCALFVHSPSGDASCDEDAADRYLWPPTVPPFLTDSWLCRACKGLAAGEAPWLFADPRGRLVIRRTPHQARPDNRYDIVDRAGRLAEIVTLPRGEAIVGFGEATVYTVREDEFDLQWLRRHPWR